MKGRDLKDGVLAVNNMAKKIAMARLPGFSLLAEMPNSQLNNGLKSDLASAFDDVVSTVELNPLKLQAQSTVMVKEISREEINKSIKGKSHEYIAGMLVMLGLLPSPDDPKLKAKAFALYVRNLQDNDPELEAKLADWSFEDMQKKLTKNLEDLIKDNQEKDTEEDLDFMRDWQHEQMMSINLSVNLNSSSTREEVEDAIDRAIVVAINTANKNNRKVNFEVNRVQETKNTVMTLLKQHPELVIKDIQVRQDGEINLVFQKNALFLGLRLRPDGSSEEMKLKGESATVTPALMFFTNKSGDVTKNILKGAEVVNACGANNQVAKQQPTAPTPFNTTPLNRLR